MCRSDSIWCDPDTTDAAGAGNSANQNPQASSSEIWGTPCQGQHQFDWFGIWLFMHGVLCFPLLSVHIILLLCWLSLCDFLLLLVCFSSHSMHVALPVFGCHSGIKYRAERGTVNCVFGHVQDWTSNLPFRQMGSRVWLFLIQWGSDVSDVQILGLSRMCEVLLLSFTRPHCKTFVPYIPHAFKEELFTPCKQWVKIHPWLLHMKLSRCTPWVKIAHDFYIVKLSRCTPWVEIAHDFYIVKLSCCMPWVKIARDFYIVKLSQCTPWVKIARDFYVVKLSRCTPWVKIARDFYVVKLSRCTPWVKITRDFYIVKMSWCTPWVKITRDFYIVKLSPCTAWVKITLEFYIVNHP